MQQFAKIVSQNISRPYVVSCESCIDGKIVKTAFSSMELLLSRMENGLKLPDEMMILITNLGYTAGILCNNCEKELDK